MCGQDATPARVTLRETADVSQGPNTVFSRCPYPVPIECVSPVRNPEGRTQQVHSFPRRHTIIGYIAFIIKSIKIDYVDLSTI